MTNDFIAWAQQLLDDWATVRGCRPRTNIDSAVELEYLKDQLDDWAHLLRRYSFDKESTIDLAETCYQFESRLEKYKKKVVIEALHHGTIH